MQRTFLMVMKPKHGILCLLDRIFDFFDIEELGRMTGVWRLFCFAATLERNYTKFGPTIERAQVKYEDSEIHQMVSNCIQSIKKKKAIFSSESTIFRTESKETNQ